MKKMKRFLAFVLAVCCIFSNSTIAENSSIDSYGYSFSEPVKAGMIFEGWDIYDMNGTRLNINGSLSTAAVFYKRSTWLYKKRRLILY